MTQGGPFLVATPWSHPTGKRHAAMGETEQTIGSLGLALLHGVCNQPPLVATHSTCRRLPTCGVRDARKGATLEHRARRPRRSLSRLTDLA